MILIKIVLSISTEQIDEARVIGFMYQPVQSLVVLKKILRRDNGSVYLAGYRGDLLIDYGEISSSGGK